MNELLRDIKLNQLPLLSVFRVRGAVLGTIRNKKPVTHFPSRNSFHYSGWSRDAICYVESVMIMVKTTIESNKCVWIIQSKRARKIFHEKWVLESQYLRNITAHFVHYLCGALRPSMSLLVLRPCFVILRGRKFNLFTQSNLPSKYSWWLERASLGCISLWL